MTTPRPDELETFGGPARMPRLLARLFGLNPLVRSTDRVEALLVVLAFAVSILALPVAAAVGTAVHESRAQVYAEQAQTGHKVVATITGEHDGRRNLSSPTLTAPARWVAAGAEHSGMVAVSRAVKPGDRVDVWVDEQGSPVSRPMFSALDEAVMAGSALWFGVVIAAAALFGLARIVLDRRRHAGWQRDFDRMVGGSAGE
jgi:hypothetical protein